MSRLRQLENDTKCFLLRRVCDAGRGSPLQVAPSLTGPRRPAAVASATEEPSNSPQAISPPVQRVGQRWPGLPGASRLAQREGRDPSILAWHKRLPKREWKTWCVWRRSRILTLSHRIIVSLHFAFEDQEKMYLARRPAAPGLRLERHRGLPASGSSRESGISVAAPTAMSPSVEI